MSPAQAPARTGEVATEAGVPRALGTGEQLRREDLLGAPLRFLPHPSRLLAPLTSLQGAGPKLAAAAAELGIDNVGDLLRHIPRGYRDRSEVRLLGELKIGEEGTVEVEVRSARIRPTRRRRLRIVEATVADESGPAKAVWFNQDWLAERLRSGTRLLLNGKLDRQGFRVSTYEILGAGGAASGEGIHTRGIVPAHPASEALPARRLRDWTWQALPLAGHAVEPLPARLRTRHGFAGVAGALRAVHFPDDLHEAEAARERLAFEELFLHQVALAARRRGRERSRPGVALDSPGELSADWLRSLPFELTADQRKAIAELDADLVQDRPMQRLLMGEVGSGKTVIALFAMLRAVESGWQAALMAPTETLAEQHFATLERLAPPLPLALLTSSVSAASRRATLARLESGELQLLVGTHALIESSVAFAGLALAVVDEQHRFGVRQRAELDAKGPAIEGRAAAPHTLHMTATPIPRTLSLTAYGDLDASVLRELPAGRRPVATWVVGEEKRAGAYEFIREQLRAGRQAYVVCPLVSESEKLQARAATVEGERLARSEFRDFEVAVLHGQMPAAEKQEAMRRFAAGDASVLVATSVIEVGIDVPNATVMLIEEADRYGLSQLHQLRGRVGRGEHDSHCILFADPASEAARIRLEAIAEQRDGFKLAEVDLSLRGEGEILGTRQHGLPRFRAASLPEDISLLTAAREEVAALLRTHGDLDAPDLGPLLVAARERFGDERTEALPA
jgi:ATP-dependent DNA helicase RecG